jgi:hypothetical protein
MVIKNDAGQTLLLIALVALCTHCLSKLLPVELFDRTGTTFAKTIYKLRLTEELMPTLVQS